MVPGAWPAPPSTPQRQATSSGESSLIDPAAATSSTPNPPVSSAALSIAGPSTAAPTGPSTPSLPNVDCTLRKRKRSAAPEVDLQSLRAAKQAYYESGRVYFVSATRYFDQMYDSTRRDQEQAVLNSMMQDLEDDEDNENLQEESEMCEDSQISFDK